MDTEAQKLTEHQYAVVTPTYQAHFECIKNYLKSLMLCVKNRSDLPIYFTISCMENAEFEKIIKPFRKALNIKVLFMEELLKKFHIQDSCEALLRNYGRFTFQTLKKMYTMLHVDAEYFLVLDSESMWVNPTDMEQVFNDFFSAPFISGTILKPQYRTSPYFNLLCENINFLLGFTCDRWLLENFVWFYEKRILNELFSMHGSLIEMAERLRQHNSFISAPVDIKNGIFEITLYQNFVYKHQMKYSYTFIDLDKELQTTLSKNLLDLYERDFYATYHGDCGLLEHIQLLLSPQNVLSLGEMFKRLRFNIIRCERICRFDLQSQFMNIVQPIILASSQNHGFGLYNTMNNILINLMKENTAWKKCKKHWRAFLAPFKFFGQWVIEPVSTLWYFINFIIEFIILLIKVKVIVKFKM
jgi:hypothetical protein